MKAQEVDMKKKKKESNKWTQSMTFLRNLYKCNILGCTATLKGQRSKLNYNCIWNPSYIVPIQNGVDAGIIHDPASIKISHFSREI